MKLPHECQHHDCPVTDARHALIWRCRNGHLETVRYCSGHIDAAILRDLQPAENFFCEQCYAPLHLGWW